MLYVPLDFEIQLKVDALLDIRAYVSEIFQGDLDTMKQKVAHNSLKVDDLHNFQIQVANGQSEKPLERATLEFETRDNFFAQHLLMMMKKTGPLIELHFMRNNSVFIDTTHGVIQFPHLTMQFETASSETTAKLQLVILDNALALPVMTTETITVFADHPSE